MHALHLVEVTPSFSAIAPGRRHVLIVEDDAVAAAGFHRQVAPALQQLAASSEPWLYLKLWCDDQRLLRLPSTLPGSMCMRCIALCVLECG